MTAGRAHSWASASGARLGVVAVRRYRLVVGRRAEPTTEDATDPATPRELLERSLTDVIVEGCAHARQEVTELTTSVTVEALHKRVRVRGDRRIRIGKGGELRAETPEPFRRMPLDWTRAYGGRDVYAEASARSDSSRQQRFAAPWARGAGLAGAFSYPRNAVGRGFFARVDVERLDGELLPNLDDPDDPVETERILADDSLDWIDRPVAAGYGAIDALTFPRCMFHVLRPDWRPPARPPREIALGVLSPSDMPDPSIHRTPDPRFFNRAATGLATHRLLGDERASLAHLHPRHELFECALPADRPRLLIEPPGTRTYELGPQLATVLLEPDQERVTLTWTGSMPVSTVYPEAMCKEMRHAAIWSR